MNPHKRQKTTPNPTTTMQMADSNPQFLLDGTNNTGEDDTSYTMFKVLPRLYISKFPTTIPSNITHVLNMCTHSHPNDPTRTYLHIPLNDIDNIKPHLAPITIFINRAFAKDGVVLVHCAFGVNRSAAAVLAYLCYRSKMTASDALKELKKGKPDVNPSLMFMAQINQAFGKREKTEAEDPLAQFHKRLQERKARG